MNRYSCLLKPNAIMIYAIAFLVGSLYSQIFPTLGVHLVEKYGSDAWDLGLFFVSLAGASIVVSQLIGKYSDSGVNRLWLIFFGLSAGGLACFIFAISNSYSVTFIAAISLYAIASISVPQLMAHAREYAESHVSSDQVALFNCVLRVCFSFSWIAGPPIGFLLQDKLGEQSHYVLTAFLHIAVALVAIMFLPKKVSMARGNVDFTAANVMVPVRIKYIFMSIAILFALNHSYQIALPQYLLSEMGLSSVYAGYLMGLAAAIEIPVMLIGGWLSMRFSISSLVRVGAICATLLYFGFWIGSELWQLFLFQVFNAIFIGMIAGLGITIFQNSMPNNTGYASTLFGNAINLGVLLGSISIGLVAAKIGYRDLFLFNSIAGVVAVLLIPIEERKSNVNTLLKKFRPSPT